MLDCNSSTVPDSLICVHLTGSDGKPGNEDPLCWLKNSMEPVDKGQPQRAHGLPNLHAFSCGSNWGTPFVAAVLCFSLVYVGGGILYGKLSSGKSDGQAEGGRVLRAHPHHREWGSFVAFVADGIAFSRGKLGGQRQGYAKVSSVGGSKQATVGKREASGCGGRRGNTSNTKKKKHDKIQKNEKNKRKQSKQESKHDHGGSNSNDDAPGAGSASVADPEVKAVVGTAAGGGGRWVHIPA
eukprot:COSAG05_NODE_2282_length_3288_cov_5.913452_1_plen_239_part_00